MHCIEIYIRCMRSPGRASERIVGEVWLWVMNFEIWYLKGVALRGSLIWAQLMFWPNAGYSMVSGV